MNTYDFIKESNLIEGITRDPTQEEIDEYKRFIALPFVTVKDLETFVSIYEPTAVLRDVLGLDVSIGMNLAPSGGPQIRDILDTLLKTVKDSYNMHIAYEHLHPFSDCNGRSGRMLWRWQVCHYAKYWKRFGFLQAFYYQTLMRSNK